MKSIRLILILSGCLLIRPAIGQHTNPDPYVDSEGNKWHQLYLDFRATQLIELRYSPDSAITIEV